MIEKLSEEKLTHNRIAVPGDIAVIKIHDESGNVIETLEYPITEQLTITHLSIIKLENELGYKNGLGAIFGEK